MFTDILGRKNSALQSILVLQYGHWLSPCINWRAPVKKGRKTYFYFRDRISRHFAREIHFTCQLSPKYSNTVAVIDMHRTFSRMMWRDVFSRKLKPVFLPFFHGALQFYLSNLVTMMYGAFESWWLAQIECPSVVLLVCTLFAAWHIWRPLVQAVWFGWPQRAGECKQTSGFIFSQVFTDILSRKSSALSVLVL